MSLTIRNTSDLVDFSKFRAKLLAIGPPGIGKTTLVGTIAEVVGAKNVGVVSAEPGDDGGLKSIARQGVDYVVPVSYFEALEVTKGSIFKDKQAIIVDGVDVLISHHTRKYAVGMTNKHGGDTGSPRRAAGVPDKSDYQTIGVAGRDLLRAYLDMDKHILMTANMRADRPGDDDAPGTILTYGPDIPGQLYRGIVAMVDISLFVMGRSILRDPKDPKSRFSQRYLITEPGNGTYLAKSRLSLGDKRLTNVLPNELPFDLETGEGTMPDLFERVRKAYQQEGSK